MKQLYSGLCTALLLFVLLWPSLLFAAEPARDPFYSMGHELSGNRTFDQATEHVDPFSGFVTLSNTDLVLPGNGGLDVKLIRTYNSAIWGRRDVGNPGLVAWNDWSPLGIGWAMHMGIVRNPSGSGSANYMSPNNPIVEMPDGSQHILYIKQGASPNMITREYWTYKSVGSGIWELTFSDGTVYTFKYIPGVAGYSDNAGVQVAQVTSIQNASRTSTISISYYLYGSYSFLKTITDSVGRSIQFNYDYAGHKLNTITVDNRTFSYTYQAINTGVPLGNQNFLTQVTPPTGGGSPWKYSYNSAGNTYDLQTVTYPSGGTITYNYSDVSFATGAINVPFRVVQTRTTGGWNSAGSIPAGTWTYAYNSGNPGGATTTITGPGNLTEVHKFNGWGNSCPGQGPCSSIWQIGLPISKSITINGSTVLSEAYIWTKGTQTSSDYMANGGWLPAGVTTYDYVYMPFMSSKSVSRDGKTYTTNYSSFDTYGNPGYISESGDKARTSSISYWTNTTENIVRNKPSSVTVTGSYAGSFTTAYTYDFNSGNVTQMNKYGVTTNYSYNANGNLYYSIDANSKTTYYQWSYGRISQIQPSEPGTTINRVVNSNGTIASETNGRNYTAYFAYDGILRLTSITPPAGNTTTYSYSADNSTKTQTRGSYYANYYYDGFGRPSGTSDIKGITTNIVYKSYEVKDYSTSNIGDRTNFDYFGRPTSVVHQDGASIGYSYSGSNVTVTDEAVHYTYLYYGAFGDPDEKWLDHVYDANGTTTSYNYNMLGSVTSITQGTTTRNFSYDGIKNFLLSESTPEKGSITYGRDSVGNMTSKTDAIGTVNYGYDNNYRLKTITYGANTITFAYDGANNRTLMDSSAVALIDYTYDGANRLTVKSETIATRPYTTSYGYDGNDNLTSITYPFGRIVTYGYNGNNQVTSVTWPGGSITPINYCTTAPCIGLPSSFTASDVKTTSFQYTSRNLTSRITTSSSVSDVAYGYTDNRGNMTSLTDYVNTSPSRNQTMAYDNLNRLSTFNGAWGSGSFTYFANGDRSLKTVAGVNTNYSYSSNRLTSTSGGEAATFSYNNSGDLTSLNGVPLTIDMLHNVTSYNGTPAVSFTYDGDGMRVTKSSGGNKVVYHYDKEGRLLSEDGGNGVLIADYVYLHGKLAAKVINSFTVTASAGQHGSLDASTPSPQTANYNGTSTFIFNADPGYHVAGVSGCGGTPYTNTDNTVNSYTYTTGVITADCNAVSATFAINQYKVTPSPGAGGYFSPATQQTVNYNLTASFTVYPNSGYHITAISGCGGTSVGPQPTNNSYLYTTGPITTDCTVTANFSNTYTVSATAGANGSLDTTYRTSPQTVTYNGTTSFKFNANPGYHVTSVSGCGGTSYNNTSNAVTSYIYTTGTITADCAITASFAINTYTVSASAGVNGSLDTTYRTSPQTVNHNGTTSFKFNADNGYHAASVSGCGGTAYNNASNTVTNYIYTTGAITADCTVTATFAINQYQVTASAGANSSLDVSTPSPQVVNYNGAASFKFNANTNYHVASVSGCGGTAYNNTDKTVSSFTYTTGAITADCTVIASFMINPPNAGFTFTVTPTSGEVPLKVQFTDSSTLSPTSWSWNFGDNSYSTEQNPVHVFETYGTGNYTVSLTATNAGGPGSVTKTISVVACSNPHSVKLSSSGAPYDSISTAYAAAIVGDRIQSQAIHFTGNLIIDKNIILDGGYDCTISQKIGNTTIKGTTNPAISIEAGSAIMDGIAIE
ncbi:MAG: PKD domain-containing protein [Nitrospiraceae bacterium]|nr:PKD domain-containing protein [Nitrospiraceae bacterium]